MTREDAIAEAKPSFTARGRLRGPTPSRKQQAPEAFAPAPVLFIRPV